MGHRAQYAACILVALFLVLNISLLCYFTLSSYRHVQHFVTQNCSSIVISLATFGSRIFKIEPTIQSLIRQTESVDFIVVNIALESRVGNVSRASLLQYLSTTFDSCVESSNLSDDGIHCFSNDTNKKNRLLFLIGPDLGPATKVLGTIKRMPSLDDDTCIISVDDDVLYDEHMVKALVSRAPSDGALGFSCEEIPYELELVHFFFPSVLWWYIIDKHSVIKFIYDDVVKCNGWLHGWQGILYRKSFFSNNDILDSSMIPEGCFYADDVRLAGYLWTKGIKRYVFPHFLTDGKENIHHLKKNASDALSLIQNTMLIKQWPCVQHFGWYE